MTSSRPLVPLVSLLVLLAWPGAPALAQTPSGPTPKYGGMLVTHPLSATPSFSPHEESTVATTQQASPCFNNLIYYDPAKKQESVDTIIPELAERWSWQDGHRNLVFFLRKDVKWHDGKPFTSADVKYTFDAVRGAPDAKAKLKVNPRKLWYENVDAIEAPDPYTVVFRLKKPQPSLLPMLASGYSPVYPAHVPLAEFKNKCIGTGPFKLKENKPGEYVEYVKNPDYFVKGRPYLDGLKFIVIRDRSTQIAAVQSGSSMSPAPAGTAPTRRTRRAARRSSSWSRPTATSTTISSSTSRSRRSTIGGSGRPSTWRWTARRTWWGRGRARPPSAGPCCRARPGCGGCPPPRSPSWPAWATRPSRRRRPASSSPRRATGPATR